MTSRNRRVWLGLVVALLAVVLVAAGAMAGSGKERFQWIVVDKLTLLEGGATFNSATTFADTVSFSSTDLDLDGNSLILDSDGDSSLTADTDDQLDLELSGGDEYHFTTSLFDVNANAIDLDADNDTSIAADTDDQIDFELGGADIVVFNEWGASDIVTDTTEHLVEIVDSSPVITGGTVALSALNIDLGIGNSTGGTNTVYGILVGGITQDAQNTETAIALGDGWDVGLELGNNSLTLDQGSKIDHEDATSEMAVFATSIALTYNVTSTVTGGQIPANANVVDWALVVSEVFDGSGTDIIVCGIAGDTDKWVDDLDASAAGRNEAADANDLQQDEWLTSWGDIGGSDQTAQCQYTDQNNNAAAGAATFILWWALD